MKIEFERMSRDEELRCWVGEFTITHQTKYLTLRFMTSGVDKINFRDMVFEFTTMNKVHTAIAYNKDLFDAIEILAWDYMAPGIEAHQNVG